MKHLFLCTILFIAQCIYSQEESKSILPFDFSLMNDKRFIDSIPDFPKDLYEYYQLKTTRELDFGVEESIFHLVSSFHKGNIGLSKYKMFDIHILSRNDSVFAIIGDIPGYLISTYFNTDEISLFIQQHDSIYKTSTSSLDLFVSDILSGESYGYICGEAPIIYKIPEHRGLRFGDTKNIKEFRKWLRSYSPELQTYGVDALSYLYKTYHKISDDIEAKNDKRIIEHIKQRNSILDTCSGCFIGIYEKVF